MSAATAVAAVRSPGRIPRPILVLGLGILAALLFLAFNGQDALPHDDDAATFHRFNDLREWIDANRNTNPLLVIFVSSIRLAIGALFDGILALLQLFGWAGLTAVAVLLGLWAPGSYYTPGVTALVDPVGNLRLRRDR